MTSKATVSKKNMTSNHDYIITGREEKSVWNMTFDSTCKIPLYIKVMKAFNFRTFFLFFYILS